MRLYRIKESNPGLMYLFLENYYELYQEEANMDLLEVTLLAFEHNQKISHLKKSNSKRKSIQ